MGTPIRTNPVFVKESHFQLLLKKTKTQKQQQKNPNKEQATQLKNTKETTYN